MSIDDLQCHRYDCLVGNVDHILAYRLSPAGAAAQCCILQMQKLAQVISGRLIMLNTGPLLTAWHGAFMNHCNRGQEVACQRAWNTEINLDATHDVSSAPAHTLWMVIHVSWACSSLRVQFVRLLGCTALHSPASGKHWNTAFVLKTSQWCDD